MDTVYADVCRNIYICIHLQTFYMDVQIEIEIYKHISEKEADRHTQTYMSIDLCMQI